MTSALSLIPFVLAAGYALKLLLGTAPDAGRTRDLCVAALATAYTVFLLYAAGPKYILFSFIVYAPGTVLFVMARREEQRQLFSPREGVILVISILGALTGVLALAAGWIAI